MDGIMDFLLPENASEKNETPEIKSQENSESTNTTDFFKGDGSELESKDELETESVEESVDVQEPDDTYHDLFMSLVEQGLIDPDNLPDDVSTDPETRTTAEDTLKAVLHNLPTREQSVLQFGQNSLMQKLPKEVQSALMYADNDGDPIDYLRVALETQDLKSLDPESEKDQERILREFYKTTDLTSEEITEKIEELKDIDHLKKEALKLKPKLDKRAEQIATQKLESQAALKEEKDKISTATANRIGSTLAKGFEGMSFTQEEAISMIGAIMNEQEFNYGTHSATKTGIEYLIDYHKYSQGGDPARVVKALMILDPNGKYDERFAELQKRKMQKKFVNEHVTNSQNKFKMKESTTKPSSDRKSSGKFKFKSGL